ncbi:hypothetical protein PFISCL1PPCAC_5718 [Pristionchus fissidentatus]|uniref:Coiled-coil domain-containing protein 93 n=1 Tax=Pristionchus fissidentatus TaxID=1538716 RepID=A0AAV5V6R2_9BILA|nr:hypothetical protein PFISCL1PPCAC_5718 [Pristionchus fissidentatus]
MKHNRAADGVFDIREDEEQYEKLQNCLDLLVAAGYFRARVKGISAFDKIVGGMVWCISTLNYSIDVDLLFTENSSIGQKIALTEKIVEVLPLIKCPHSIEPHQIQGFDFIHVFPVIQWLVKRACEASEEHGDDLKMYVDHIYRRNNGPKSSPSSSLSSRLAILSKEVGAPNRIYKRMDGVSIDSLNHDIQYTLAEYDHGRLSHSENASSSSDLIDTEDKEGLQIVSSKGRTKLSGRALRALVEDESMADVFHALKIQSEEKNIESVAEMKERTANIRLETEELEKKNEKEKEEVRSELEELREKETTIGHYNSRIDKFTPDEIEELTKLIDDYSSVSRGESEFKKECREELESMEREIDELRARIDNEEAMEDEESSSALLSLESHLSSLRESTAESLQRLNKLQRKSDEIASEAEIAQYHKRFIELGNDILSEHRRLRGAFDEFNTMVDVKEYLEKENDLLNTVEDIVTKSRGDYRDPLNEKLSVVLRGLENTLDKLSCKESLMTKEGEGLAQILFDMREKERGYYRTVDALKKTYERNAQLRNELKKRGLENIADI